MFDFSIFPPLGKTFIFLDFPRKWFISKWFLYYCTSITQTLDLNILTHLFLSLSYNTRGIYFYPPIYHPLLKRALLPLPQPNQNSNPNLLIPPISCLPGITLQPNISFLWVVPQFQHQTNVIKLLFKLGFLSISMIIYFEYLFYFSFKYSIVILSLTSHSHNRNKVSFSPSLYKSSCWPIQIIIIVIYDII